MLVPQSHAAVRKGTKSCTECRRRKVRCVRIPEDAPTCRQCAERNTACRAQTATPRPRQTQRMPSRYRISQLESQVNRLTNIVSSIEVKLGGKSSLAQTIGQTPDSAESDTESSASEIVTAEGPPHLRSLFQNDWLSVDIRRQQEQCEERREKASIHLLELARPALQRLIPSKEETADMMVCTYDWLNLVHMIMPQPFVAKSHQEILEQHDAISQPDVDVIALASWLLAVALIAQQFPQGKVTEFKSTQRRLEFSRAVSDTVENTVLAHDRLVGTLQGLGMALNYIRLQMGRGNFQRAWVKLRHITTLAELMGLPKTAQRSRLKKSTETDYEATQDHEALLWEIICNVDRLSSIMVNLPPYTKRYKPTTPPAVTINGIVQPRVYLSRLLDVAPKIYDMEDHIAINGSPATLYTSALEIAREVRELASLTPRSWWTINMSDDLKPHHIVQFMHYCVIMRAYLPLALRQGQSEECIYSRLACMDACESIAHRYQFIRQKLPPGFFSLRILDLQAFTAAVVLLLTSNACPSSDCRTFQIDKVRLESVVSEVIKLMREKSKAEAASGFVGRGANTLCALRDLLQEEVNAARVQDLTVNVPLLGNIHVRRNLHTCHPPRTQNQQSSETQQQPGIWKPYEPTVPSVSNPSRNPNTFVGEATHVDQTGPEMPWDNLSWFIEDTNLNLLEDSLLGENLDQAVLWPNPYYHVPFS